MASDEPVNEQAVVNVYIKLLSFNYMKPSWLHSFQSRTEAAGRGGRKYPYQGFSGCRGGRGTTRPPLPPPLLLDEDMNPKIADFGLARMFNVSQTHESTEHFAGTLGYIAPEYLEHYRYSVKSDVYSFGVLVLEILCGQKINNFRIGENEEHLLSYAWKSWREGTYKNIIDPNLANSSSTSEIKRCIHIGLLCVQKKVSERPTMASVDLMLKTSSPIDLPVPSHPAFFTHSNVDEILSLSKNDVSITELHPR